MRVVLRDFGRPMHVGTVEHVLLKGSGGWKCSTLLGTFSEMLIFKRRTLLTQAELHRLREQACRLAGKIWCC